AVPWIARLPGAPRFRVFLTMAGDEAVGTGALYLAGGVAWTDFGATDPAFRGRGAQGANLAHRVRAAIEAGARRIHTCTGVAVPGEAQHSYGNIRRCGFTETHV